MRRPLLAMAVALLLSGCGISGSIDDFLTSEYEVLSRNGQSVELRSPQPPAEVTAAITDRFDPLERADVPAGSFLRYSDDFVAVRPDPAGGALISLDDDEVGLRRWSNEVGNQFTQGDITDDGK